MTNPFKPLDLTKGSPSSNLGSGGNSVSINQQLIGCDSRTNEVLSGMAENANELYGLEINYWRKSFDVKKAHPIWGNQDDAGYIGPFKIKAYVNVEDDSSILSQFGMDTSNQIDLQISYEEWEKVSKTDSPLAKDIFEIDGLLECRPSGHTRAIFELTSQGDGDLFTASKRWFISAQRKDGFSFEDNEPRENNDDIYFTDESTGPVDINGDANDLTEDNPLDYSIDDVSRENYDNDDDDAFGGFYS